MNFPARKVVRVSKIDVMRNSRRDVTADVNAKIGQEANDQANS